MKPFPQDSMAAHSRFIAALCDDFASPEYLRTGKTPAADAALAAHRSVRPFTAQELADATGDTEAGRAAA